MTGPIVRLDEVRDPDGSLTHRMCCICFEMTAVESLWRDPTGQRWDLCSGDCARDAFGDDLVCLLTGERVP